MSRRGGDELTSLLRNGDVQRDDGFRAEYRSFLRTVLVIFFLVVVASVIAIVVLWMNKPPKPVVCTGLSSNSSGFQTVFADYPNNPIQFFASGQIYKFSFQTLGNHNMQVSYRLCNTPLSNETSPICRNYTVSSAYIENTFADVALKDCQDSILTLEFLQFQPKPALLMYCASTTEQDYQSYCITGGVGSFSEAGFEDDEQSERPFGWWGSFVTNGSEPFTATYTRFLNESTSLQLGFCGQTYGKRVLPAVNYSTCWNTGFMNDTCVPGISGNQKESDFFSGIYTFNLTKSLKRQLDSLYHFTVAVNGTNTGLYVAAIGERPFIDSICKLK